MALKAKLLDLLLCEMLENVRRALVGRGIFVNLLDSGFQGAHGSIVG
jgi:hypothetical protein